MSADPAAEVGRGESAGRLVDDNVVVASPTETVAAFAERPGIEPGRYVAICEAQRLLGLVETAALLAAEPTRELGTLARKPRAVVSTSTGGERAAWVAAHAGADVVAVEEESGEFRGLISANRLLTLMVHEHEEDMARFAGYLSDTSQARTASEEPLSRRIWHRAPWLLVGLLGAVLAAQIVRAFESKLEATVALAFFLPGIVYMADAVGTQTETLVVRGFSVGITLGRILRLEALTGLAVGLLLSTAMFPLAYGVTGEADIALVVALSLLASTSCATVVAMSLPWFIERLKFDPAFGSGPLATVIQDLLSILIYFGIAVAIV